MTEREQSDADVFARSVREPRAFTIIFDRYYRPVYGYLSRRVGRSVADDLAAETFARAFERRSTYLPTAERALPWLLGIALNLLAHHRRSAGRQLRALAALEEQDHSERIEEAASRRVDARAARQALVVAVERLDEQDREPLLLYAWGELTYAEVAEVLGIPIGTVRSRLNRARRSLREVLEPHADGNVIQLPRKGAQSG
jgi:RNA polymerase sigma-70 factor (ECF subfamily)